MISKTGIVTSVANTKTIVAEVSFYKSHPKYKKKFKVSKKFHIHNPENTKFEIGQTVTFYETRPISKLKKWTLINPTKQ